MNRKKIILVLLLSFFIGLVNVNAFTCKVRCSNLGEEYCNAIYIRKGDGSTITSLEKLNGDRIPARYYVSEFNPTTQDLCPFVNNTEVFVEDNTIFVRNRANVNLFTCTIETTSQKYIVAYYSNGDIRSVAGPSGNVYTEYNGKTIQYESDFKPKKMSECPGDKAKIIMNLSGGKISIKAKTLDSDVKKVSCGNITGIPKKIPELTSSAVTLVQVAIPVLLVIMGSIDLFKGITAQKEDEIKKGQHMFIKRLIVAVAIFFVVAIVKVLVSLVSDATNTTNIVECIDCFISGVENCKV